MRVPKTHIPAERDTPATAVGSAPSRAPADLIVLSNDHALLSVIQSAAQAQLLLWPAATADAVVEHLVAGRCGILLVDLVHLRGEIAVLLTRLTAQFPHLVLMVAGRREDEGTVAQLLTRGVVYRFIHKPISPGRAQQFLSAALRRHQQLNEREPPGLATVRELVRTKLWQQLFKHSVRAAGLIGVLGASAYIAVSVRDGIQQPSQLAVQAPLASDALPAEAAQPRTDAGQRLRSSAPPPSAAAAVGLDQQLLDIRWMVDAGRLNDAMRAVREASRAVPDDARVAIIATTIGDQLLTRASAALAEGNFELAQRRLDAAHELDTELRLDLPGLQSGIDALDHARRAAAAQALEAILVVVRERREAGELIEPAGASAYDQLLMARSQSADAETVLAESQALALACIDAAERAIAEHRFDAATALLDRADELVPAMSAVRELRRELVSLQGSAEDPTSSTH